MCHKYHCNNEKVMLASAFGLCGNCYFRLKAYSAWPGTQNDHSLLDFAEIVSSEWVYFSYSDDNNICDSFLFNFFFFVYSYFLPWKI